MSGTAAVFPSALLNPLHFFWGCTSGGRAAAHADATRTSLKGGDAPPGRNGLAIGVGLRSDSRPKCLILGYENTARTSWNLPDFLGYAPSLGAGGRMVRILLPRPIKSKTYSQGAFRRNGRAEPQRNPCRMSSIVGNPSGPARVQPSAKVAAGGVSSRYPNYLPVTPFFHIKPGSLDVRKCIAAPLDAQDMPNRASTDGVVRNLPLVA